MAVAGDGVDGEDGEVAARQFQERPGETETVGVSAPAYPAPAAMTDGQVGRYIVMGELGRGGMGRVLRAYDPKLQREVALKIVRSDVFNEELTARLVTEARAMAKLSHPNVVAVFDVEEPAPDDRRPAAEARGVPGVVLVMEYVAGQTLRHWLAEDDRTASDAIEMFVNAGRGLAAAHAAGILHRDFKPANVLVSTNGVVKVTDFGLAKSTSSASLSGGTPRAPSSDSEVQTEAGTVIGTPRYMAPEQHRGSALTAASDQYALCVALWEALCGEPPFAGPGMVADKHRGPPAWPNPAIARPVATAIARGLSPTPSTRWRSMDALLDELSRDSARSRVRWGLALASLGVLAAGVAWNAQARRAVQRCAGAPKHLEGLWDESRRGDVRRALLGGGEAYAQRVWDNTRRELDDYVAAWTQMYIDACESTTVRRDQPSDVMDLRMACLRRAAVDLDAAVTQLSVADGEVLRRAHQLTGELPPLSRCADVEALASQLEPPLPAQREAVEQIRGHLAAARMSLKAGRPPQSKQALDAALAMADIVEYGPARAELALTTAEVLRVLGDFEGAEVALLEAIRRAGTWRLRNVMQQAVTQLTYLVGYQLMRMDEGLRYAAVARGLADRNQSQSLTVARVRGMLLYSMGNAAEAEVEFRRALESQEQALGSDDLQVATLRGDLANVLLIQGRYDEAEAEHVHALRLREEQLGANHPLVGFSRANLAALLFTRGAQEESDAELRRAITILEDALGSQHPDVAAFRSNLGISLESRGRYEEAEREYRRALSAELAALGPHHPAVATSRDNLAGALDSQGRTQDAEAEFHHALAIRIEALGDQHPDVAQSRYNLATFMLGEGRNEEAIRFAEQAWHSDARQDVAPSSRAGTAFLLARALWTRSGSADRTRARMLAQHAQRLFSSAGPEHALEAEEVTRWLEDP